MSELYRSHMDIIKKQADEVAKAVNLEIRRRGLGLSPGTAMVFKQLILQS